MIKLLVMSDTHGDTSLAEKVIKKHTDVNVIIHLGDCVRDGERLQEDFPEKRFELVAGNSEYQTGFVPSERSLMLEGQKVLLTHGHQYSVKWGIERLHAKALGESIQLLLYGHTHMPSLEYGPGYILLNPGSISQPRGREPESYAVVVLDKGRINVELMHAM